MRTVSALATVAAMFGTSLSGGLALAQPKFEPEVAFQLLDENGDGAVARDEFGRRKTEIFFVALDAAGAEQALRPNDVRLTVEAFGRADINGDGLLSVSEFIQAPFSWFDWTLLEKHADVHRFVGLLNARRLLRDVEHERARMTLDQMIRQASKAWHGVKVGQPDWGDHSHSLAFEAVLRREALRVYLILNAFWEPLEFELPPVGDDGAGPWHRWIDTGREAPLDIVPWQTAPPWSGDTYRAAARSVVMLFVEIGPGEAST